ncbi:L,D-transpeptidase family protein [Aestuariivirga litoralis]|uniref:L,D-transpeptidase family protein n=1 Tax=Aestuariivirga litoralis TaxID=2650924 RepID=UPI0018C76CA6
MSKSIMSRRQLLQLAAALPFSLSATRALAEDPANIGSITSIAPRIAMQGKLSTKTEILVGQGQAPMLTLGSYTALQGAIGQYEDIVAGGGWPILAPAKYDKTAKPATIRLLRQRLVREGYLQFDSLVSADSGAWNIDLIAAIKAFQYNHGALPTGKIDERTRQELNISAPARLYTLKENAPRIAEHMRDLGPRYIAVNIPGAQLEAVELGQLYSRHNVVVGKLDRPTPSLKSRVSDIIFNPTWNAPASIVAKDIIPKMLADRSYLRQMNIHIYDGVGGPEIDPASVDWQNTAPDRYIFRQESGEINSLGNVKINFPNKFMVYLHDTPHRELFATNNRWESSGCVRVDKVKNLITWVMNGQYGYDEANWDPIIQSRQTQKLPVSRGPDVRFMYLTAWATEDGRVNFRPDVYKLDGKGFILGQPEPLVAG